MNTKIKHVFASLLISASIVGGAAFFATPAAALTVDELQAQIRELVAKVTALQEQLRVALANQNTQTSTVLPTGVSKHRVCSILNRNLSQGIQGDDVRGLQEFLSSQGYLTAQATGYFGPATASAVAKWQASQGVSSVGALGPISRERIKIWCGEENESLRASPQRGQAPLDVTFQYRASCAGERMGGLTVDGRFHRIDFGDGTSVPADCHGVITHTYTSDGTYTATYVDPGGCGPNADPRCLGAPSRILGSATIYVGSVACTKEYMPVCGSKPIVCITTPCNPIQQTYSNRCMLQADGAAYVHEGQCRNDAVDPAADPRCTSWYDGCNSCSRSTPNGPAMCTLRACTPESMTKPYCTAYFDGTAGNKPPTIAGFSGPTTLSVNQSGTWTVQASDPESESLSYAITWGDEYLSNVQSGSGSAPARDSFVQTTTFTHTYAQSGTYTVVVVVRDASGQEAKTSTTVRVGEDPVACTMEYNPVCGRPVGCANTCPPGMYCAAICRLHEPQTYGNRCMLNASGAQFLHEGACTSSSGNWY